MHLCTQRAASAMGGSQARAIAPALDRWEPRVALQCEHRAEVAITELPDEVGGCAECLAAGQPWLRLRICLECGHVGCCGESPNQHAAAHARASGHPIVRSLEPGEGWSWCYVHGIAMLIPEVTGMTRVPRSPLAAARASRALQ